MTIYIAGPMTDLPKLNRPAFMAAEKRLRERGHVVLNPARLPDGLQRDKYLPVCLAMIDAAEAVLLLNGWQNSAGAKIEEAYARYQRKVIVLERLEVAP